jgi:hypothetical protein
MNNSCPLCLLDYNVSACRQHRRSYDPTVLLEVAVFELTPSTYVAVLEVTPDKWAKESWKHSEWAAAFVALHRTKGKGFHSIIRMLAVKWIRILWRCWKERCRHDEVAYIKSLRQRGSPLCQYLPVAA